MPPRHQPRSLGDLAVTGKTQIRQHRIASW